MSASTGLGWWQLEHERFWCSETVLRLAREPEIVAVYLFLLGEQNARGSLPGDPAMVRVIAARFDLIEGLWERAWKALEARFPVDQDGLRRNPVQAEKLAAVGHAREGARLRQEEHRKRLRGDPARASRTRHRDVTVTSALGSPSPSPSPSGSHSDSGGGSARTAKARRKSELVDPATCPLPAELDAPALRSEFAAWLGVRREKKLEELTPTQLARLLALFERRGQAFALRALCMAADLAWGGIREHYVDNADRKGAGTAGGAPRSRGPSYLRPTAEPGGRANPPRTIDVEPPPAGEARPASGGAR